MKSRLRSAFLVGPFVGELSWEFLRFAPYIIHLKKSVPKAKLIVFTRPLRFDLYGQYADILVPLNIPSDEVEKQFCFIYKDLTCGNYNVLAKRLLSKYETRFSIIRHIYPDITYFYSKLKWQFPRGSMDYDFRPRKLNVDVTKKYIEEKNRIVLVNFNFYEEKNLSKYLESLEFSPIFIDLFSGFILMEKKEECSFLGCVIELLKQCEFVVTKFNTYIAHLSLLVGTPVISVGKTPSPDSISLINPMNTTVISCDDIIDGINIYEGEKECE